MMISLSEVRHCNCCGGELTQIGDDYMCEFCGDVVTKEDLEYQEYIRQDR
jgi:predicted amidophosphoribosyltransferase